MNQFAVGGKLFEPKSLAESNMVWEKVKSIANAAWIGVTDKVHEGSYTYDSNNSGIPFVIAWNQGSYSYLFPSNIRYTSQNTDCVGIHGDHGHWFSNPCNIILRPSICETKM